MLRVNLAGSELRLAHAENHSLWRKKSPNGRRTGVRETSLFRDLPPPTPFHYVVLRLSTL